MDAESYRRVGDGFSGGRMCLVVMGDLGSPAEEEIESSQMDSRVWRTMPESLVEEVLRRLPIAAQMRFRSVCRRWKDTLCCPNFLWDCPPAGPVPATILTFESRFSLREWEEHPFPFIGSVNSYRLKPLRCLRFMHPCASDTGLVCLRSSSSGTNKVPPSLYVLNPMTRAWRLLPKPGGSSPLFMSVALVVDAPSKAYKVVVAALEEEDKQQQSGSNGKAWTLRIYDSCTDSWHLACSTLPGLRCRRPAQHDGVVYYLERQGVLVAFRLQDESFWEVPAARPAQLQDCACLVAHRGELLLLGVLDGSFTGFRIWRLARGGQAWEPLALLSEKLFETLFPHCGARHDSWGVLSLGDSICLDLWLYDFVGNGQQVEPVGRRVLLAYDLVIKGWYVLPIQFQDRPECKSRSVLLSFEPRLDLIV